MSPSPMATVVDADTRLDAALVTAHRDLAGLATLLDDEELSDLLGTSGGRADRLRVKPGSSARVATVDAAGRWSIVYAYAPAAWAKAAKDIAAARRAGEPFVIDIDRRIVAVRARFDRRLRAMGVWRPDSSKGPRHHALEALRPLGTLRGGIDRRALRVRTVAHNPSRRWVGAVFVADEPVAVVKVFARRDAAVRAPRAARALAAAGVVVADHACTPALPGAYVTTWAGGRHADAGADADAVGEAMASLSIADPASVAPADPAGAARALAVSLAEAAAALAVLDPQWGRRAAAVAQHLTAGATPPPRVVVHGDLSPDQVLIDGGTATVIDLDRTGRGPAGWDSASWVAAQIAAGPPDAHPVALRGPSPDAWTTAATALLRAPEPFRRRRVGRAAATEALLVAAETAAGRC